MRELGGGMEHIDLRQLKKPINVGGVHLVDGPNT